MPQTDIDIYCHSDGDRVPVHLTSKAKCIATLSLDLSMIPDSIKRNATIKKMGWHRYYSVDGYVEASYGSAQITYTVKLGGKLPCAVTARLFANRHSPRRDPRRRERTLRVKMKLNSRRDMCKIEDSMRISQGEYQQVRSRENSYSSFVKH
jgi:hypothetical protein